MRWISLEPIIQNEMSQKEKDKYHILTHVYRIQKNVTEELIYRAAMEKQTQKTDLRTQGGEGGRKEEGKVKMYGESNLETHNTKCKIDS